ncbi:MAG TPA: MFS transporter [Candidatus Limnocylindrales bacterium]|nr:MFS transporter [Candidatus Limnocylindrales bacterium]
MPNPQHHDAGGGLWSPGHRALTIGLVLTITLVASEALAVTNVMPIVAEDLAGGDPALYGWALSAFILASLVGIAAAGVLIDRGSLTRPYLLGLGLFSVGLIVCGLAPSMPILVVGRALQGLGAGAIPAVGYVAIGRALPERLRAEMFAVLSTAWVLPGLLAPGIAGAVAEVFHWRLVFLGLLPLIALAAVMTTPAIRALGVTSASEREHEVAEDSRRRLPLAIVLAIGAGLTIAGLTDAQLWPGLPLVVVGIALALPAFRRLTPPGTLRAARGLPSAVLLRGTLTFAFFCADAYVPVAFQDWRGTSAIEAGIALTAATLSWTSGAWVQARLIGRIGPRPLVRTGFLVVGVGITLFGLMLIPSVPIAWGIVAWAFTGLGMGFSYSPLALTVLREAPPETQGAATAGLQLSDVLGTALGIGVGGALIAIGDRSGGEEWVGLAAAFTVGVVAAAIGVVLAARLPGGAHATAPIRRDHPEAASEAALAVTGHER